MSDQEPLSHAQPKHSGIGFASFVISIAAGVLFFVAIVVAGVMEASTPGSMEENSAQAMILGFALIGVLVVDLVALGLGIGGLFQKERKKILAILGTVFSSAVIVGIVGVGILGAAA